MNRTFRFFLKLVCCLLFCSSLFSADPEMVLLWPGGAPGAVGDEEQDRPALILYPAPADQRSRAAVVVCPGGGYRNLAMDHEGHQVAKWFNSFGISAFILQYRLGPRYRHPAPLNDVQRAIRYVRSQASEWGIDPQKIGVMGFSAGGHLASSAGTHFDAGEPTAAESLDRLSSRPDFMVLVYPVISFTEADVVHQGSRRHLLGEEPSKDLEELLSSERQVTSETPPTFLVHADDDRGVVPENSVLFYLALRKAGVSSELHIYRRGGHGFGLAPHDAILSSWAGRLKDWMVQNGWLNR